MQKKVKKEKKDNGETVDATIKAIKDKFGEDSIMKLDQQPLVDLDSIPSGSFGLDIALGIGGFPRGRMIEIFGPESSGKTTLALHVIAEAQKKGDICAFIDAEHALDPEYAKKIGVDTSSIFISQPSCGEQGLEILESLTRSAKFGVVVVDSVAALTPLSEIEGEMGDQQMGKHARLMSQACRKLVSIISTSNTMVIFLNQIRQNIGMTAFAGPTEYTPGGKALKFYTSIRLDIRRIAQIKKGDEVVGGRTRVRVVKNKVAAPFKKTEFDLMYNEGISREGEILAVGENLKVITKEGNSYNYGDIKLGRGYDASRTYLKENKDLREELIDIITKKLKANIIETSKEESKVENE